MAHNHPERATPIEPLSADQEPFMRIIAPGLNHLSRDTFRRGSVERRRAIRGIIVLAVVIVAAAVIAVIGTLVATAR